MSDLKYLGRKDTLLKYCYLALRDHFKSDEDFNIWYERIESDKKKNTLLKVAPYYLALVKSGDWHVSIPNAQSVVEYFTNTFKYIAIFSLIESLSDLRHIDFYQYLERKETQTLFPISKDELKRKYDLYKQDYGAIQHCVGFFRNLSNERQQALVSKLEVKNTEASIEHLAKYLYGLRSRFVHDAELIHQVSNHTWLGFEGKKLVICSLSIADAMQFFEEGLLAWCNKSET
jgi:hypothetical protein